MQISFHELPKRISNRGCKTKLVLSASFSCFLEFLRKKQHLHDKLLLRYCHDYKVL